MCNVIQTVREVTANLRKYQDLCRQLRRWCAQVDTDLGLHALDDDRRGHAATGAHRDEGTLLVAALQLVERGADEDRPGGPDRMAERHRPAVDVDLVAIEVEVAHELLRHDRERLVDLEEVDVIDREAGS